MIQIQIATSLTEEGVGDIRWVLLDPSESVPMAPTAPPASASPPIASAPSGPAFEPTRPVLDDADAIATAPAEAHTLPAAAPAVRRASTAPRLLRALVIAAALAGAGWLGWNLLHDAGPGGTSTRAVR